MSALFQRCQNNDVLFSHLWIDIFVSGLELQVNPLNVHYHNTLPIFSQSCLGCQNSSSWCFKKSSVDAEVLELLHVYDTKSTGNKSKNKCCCLVTKSQKILWTEEPGGLWSMGVAKSWTQLNWLSMQYPIFIHSSVDGHWGCLHVLAFVNSATMNIYVHVSIQIMVLSTCMPRNGIAGSYGSSIFFSYF